MKAKENKPTSFNYEEQVKNSLMQEFPKQKRPVFIKRIIPAFVYIFTGRVPKEVSNVLERYIDIVDTVPLKHTGCWFTAYGKFFNAIRPYLSAQRQHDYANEEKQISDSLKTFL